MQQVEEEINIFEVSSERESSSSYDVTVTFEDAILFVEKISGKDDDSLTQTIELREPENRTIETEFSIEGDKMWVEVTDSILG